MPTSLLKLLRFFLPWACASCRTAMTCLQDEGFCGRCWLTIPRITELVCRFCGLPLTEGGGLCYACRQQRPALIVRAAVRYAGGMPPALWRFKYAGRRSLARSLGTLLIGALDRYSELRPFHALVPVPLHPTAERLRGYNQAAELALIIGKQLRLPVLDGLLVRTRKTAPSYRLNRQERQINVYDAFGWGVSHQECSKLRGVSLLLIDDVCTTTHTLGECARVLKSAPIAGVKALVVARD